MTTMYDYVRVKCPFFLSAYTKKICCEGIVNGCVTSNEFKKENLKNQHRIVFCDEAYEECELYKTLVRKYEK